MSSMKREEVLLTSLTEVVTAFDGTLTVGALGLTDDRPRRLGIAIGELGHKTLEIWLPLGASHQYRPETHEPQDHQIGRFYEIRVMKIPESDTAVFAARIMVTLMGASGT